MKKQIYIGLIYNDLIEIGQGIYVQKVSKKIKRDAKTLNTKSKEI
ncbi:hypothetical protein [Mycoplasmopsis edwardii]|nr:hypothetical protein [Mycoplasmopsis edwardii]